MMNCYRHHLITRPWPGIADSGLDLQGMNAPILNNVLEILGRINRVMHYGNDGTCGRFSLKGPH
jgi:hypothetical protein